MEHDTIHSIEDIKAGEEITITYSRLETVSEERRAFLKKKFGFDCRCRECSLPTVEIQARDALRLQAQDLEKPMMRPEKSLKSCYSLLHVLSELGTAYEVVVGARHYYDAFR
jgi:hypothetical protein